MYNTIDSTVLKYISWRPIYPLLKTNYALNVYFSDLNKSTVPMTDDNGSYVSVVGKCNIALLLLWKWFSCRDDQVNYF